MQLLNKMIIENKALQNENEALKAENAKVKQHISQLDENAVRRVTVQKDAVIESLNTQLASEKRGHYNEGRFVAISTTNHLESQKCDARSKDSQLFILSSE